MWHRRQMPHRRILILICRAGSLRAHLLDHFHSTTVAATIIANLWIMTYVLATTTTKAVITIITTIIMEIVAAVFHLQYRKSVLQRKTVLLQTKTTRMRPPSTTTATNRLVLIQPTILPTRKPPPMISLRLYQLDDHHFPAMELDHFSNSSSKICKLLWHNYANRPSIRLWAILMRQCCQ